MNSVIVCISCGQPINRQDFKNQEWKQGKTILDVKDFAVVSMELIGYCPLCAAVNTLAQSMRLTTATLP
jgi:hypothetical protein